jgi:hypothetical protein
MVKGRYPVAIKLFAKCGAVAVALSLAAIGGAGIASADTQAGAGGKPTIQDSTGSMNADAPTYIDTPYTKGMIAEGRKSALSVKLANLPKVGSAPSTKPAGSIISSLLKQAKNAITQKAKSKP